MSAAAVDAAGELKERPEGMRLRLITIALILAPLVQVFDTSLLSIALSQMQGSLSATQDQVAWVLTSYLIAVTVMTPVWGALSSIFGRKPLLLVSLSVFMVFSLLSGTSETLTEILVYRFIQGVFGAALIPLAQSSLFSVYRREDFGMAMGWWGVGLMFGPVFGPTLGGYITEYFSWRWAFYLNLPIGLIAFLMIAFLVPRARNMQKRKFNYYGFVMLGLTVASIQFILDRGERLDWYASPTIIILTLVACAALWMFVVNSLTSETPFVDTGIFRDRNYASGIVLRVLFGAMLFGSLVLIPPFVQNIGGYPLVDSGLILAPRGAGAMVSALLVGRLLKHVDPRKVIVFGMGTAALCMWHMSTFTTDIDMTLIIVNNFLQGIAFSCFIVPVNTVAFSTMAAHLRDAGTSFYSLLNNIGRSMGIALLASYLARNTQVNHSVLSEHISPFNDHALHFGTPNIFSFDNPSGLAAINQVVTRQAELISYIADFRLLALVLIVCIPVAFLMRNPHQVLRAT